MSDDDLRVGDLVSAFGLVGASHLNGKWGVIQRAANAQGRLAIEFLGDEVVKLVKQSNLKRIVLPDDKDDPRMFATRRDTGAKLLIRIENGAGHKCVDCGIDLDGHSTM